MMDESSSTYLTGSLMRTDFYEKVPKGLQENLAFRKKLVSAGYRRTDNAHELWVMCARDIKFFINAFGWTFDPRLVPKSTLIPFITYPYQDKAIDAIVAAIEQGKDLPIEKSRDMGASWIILTVFEWFWQFRPYQSFRMVSRSEDLVDKTEDPDSLFWKIDFLLRYQPSWMRPARNRTHLHLYNKDNGSTIDGSSTTSDVARGGRCTAMMLDEFAAVLDGYAMLRSTRDVTQCRIFNSTPQGANNAFHDLTHDPQKKKLTFHWSLHPKKAAGLYIGHPNGSLEILDGSYTFPGDYEFIYDGKQRSPWYDNECRRAIHSQEIAQELDIDYLGSDFQFFDTDIINQIEKEYVRRPLAEGSLDIDYDTCKPIGWVEQPDGPLKLWINLSGAGTPPLRRKYAIGVDVSAGTGASNSAMTVIDLASGEKVAEYASARDRPEPLAKKAAALAYFFNEAFIIWDAGGHGQAFGEKLTQDICYRNIYLRRNDKSISRKVSDQPGFFFSKEGKLAILGGYRRALMEGTFTQRSSQANQECLQYVFTTANTVEHSSSRNTVDPSGAQANHGDRVIADSLANKARELFRLDSLPDEEAPSEDSPEHCFAARRARRIEIDDDELWDIDKYDV